MTATTTDRAGGDVVWSGRYSGELPGWDEWSSPPGELATALDGAERIVIADPLSFPWEHVRASHLELPLVVNVEDQVVSDVLRRTEAPGARRGALFTPADVVVSDLDALRSAMASGPDLDGRTAKARFRLLAELLETELHVVARSFGKKLRVAIPRDTPPALVDRLHATAGLSVQLSSVDGHGASEGVPPGESEPAAHVALVLWDGARGEVADRVAVLRTSFGTLQPGGSLLVVADVVTPVGGSPVPSVTELFDDVHLATGMSVAAEEIKSVRWPGESMSRGVVLRYHALSLAHDVREAS